MVFNEGGRPDDSGIGKSRGGEDDQDRDVESRAREG